MTTSAFVGSPPATEDDLHIVKGVLRMYGMENANASLGLFFSIQKPENPPDETKVPGILVGMIIVILAIVIPTVARIMIRLKGARTQFGADDWAIICAASVAVVYPILCILMLFQTGAGRHTYDSTYEEYNLYMYYLNVCKIVFYVAVGLIKVSITLFVRRLADRASKKWKLFSEIFLGTVIIYILLAIFWLVFSCRPLGSAWNKRFAGSLDEAPVCVDSMFQNRFLSSMHVAQSIVLLAAPIIILWYVKINKAKKARLFFIWLVGGTTVLGGLLQQTMVTVTNDSCWQFTSAMRWTVMDLTFGTLAASLPVLDAAIMGTWSSIKTKIGTSRSNSRSRTQGWTDLEHDTRNTTTIRRGSVGDSESIENIMGRDKGMEMGILRTDEVELSYDRDTPSRISHVK
ncbi:integral membrane [Fusarium longipes]|uniref:Integral membrane n=1 Tax=Fusarium longipes TaxID=694270 RepID=A0A395T1E8_9HYPO|nr:integral membrane [Fusarium longipes]